MPGADAPVNTAGSKTYSEEEFKKAVAERDKAKEKLRLIDEEAKKAIVRVPEDQLSIAIGKNGQNVRLASKLTGYEIDIASSGAPARSGQNPPLCRTGT
mgnify:CR=1 FL=1